MQLLRSNDPIYRIHIPRIVESALPWDDPVRGAVLLLGNFDGFHLGHRSLLRLARGVAQGRPVAVMSCEPHPRSFFTPGIAPFRLTTRLTKHRGFAIQALDYVFEPRFDHRFSSQSPEDFASKVLHRDLGVSHVICGADFRFGRNRQGNPALLQKMGRRFGYGVTVAPTVASGSGRISSTLIRTCIQDGEAERALELLGADWHIEARYGPDGALRLDPSLCRPAPGLYRAVTVSSEIECAIEINAAAVLRPDRAPAQTEAIIFRLTGRIS